MYHVLNFILSSYYEVIISNISLEGKDFVGISFQNQTIAMRNGLQYFRAGVIQRAEMNDRKTFHFKEGVQIVAGLDIVLNTFGDFYVSARAVIDEKV